MKSIVVLGLAAAAVAGGAFLGSSALGAKNAQRIRVFQAVLVAGQEVEKPDSAAIGLGFFALHESTRTVDYAVTVTGLSGAPVAMHLHGPAVPGQNADPVVDLTVPGGATAQVTGTTSALTPKQMGDLKKGLFYINVHTAGTPNGEIRGQLLMGSSNFKEPKEP